MQTSCQSNLVPMVQLTQRWRAAVAGTIGAKQLEAP